MKNIHKHKEVAVKRTSFVDQKKKKSRKEVYMLGPRENEAMVQKPVLILGHIRLYMCVSNAINIWGLLIYFL